jgi:hypothetical protein
VAWLSVYVFNLDSVLLQSNSTGNGPATGGYRMALHKRPKFGRKAESRCCPILLPLAAVDKRHFSFAQPRGRFDKRVEYCLQIKRRPADDFQDIGRRGLLRSSFVTLGGAFIKFALEFCDNLLGIVCWVVRCLSHVFLLILPRDLVEATYPKRPTAAVVQS